MNYRIPPKKPFIWTRDDDAKLRELLQKRFTYSGAASVLGCRRIEVEARATELFGPIALVSTSRAAVLQARARAA